MTKTNHITKKIAKIIIAANENNVSTKVRETTLKYAPDCVIIAQEISKYVKEIGKTGYYAFTEPYRNEVTAYYNIFKDISDGTLISALPKFVQLDRYKLLYEACIPQIGIFNKEGATLYHGDNYDEYILWADTSINFYDAVISNVNSNDEEANNKYGELEKQYFGAFKNYGNIEDRLVMLSPQITDAKYYVNNDSEIKKKYKNDTKNDPAVKYKDLYDVIYEAFKALKKKYDEDKTLPNFSTYVKMAFKDHNENLVDKELSKFIININNIAGNKFDLDEYVLNDIMHDAFVRDFTNGTIKIVKKEEFYNKFDY
jgi:hypothetical protein